MMPHEVKSAASSANVKSVTGEVKVVEVEGGVNVFREPHSRWGQRANRGKKTKMWVFIALTFSRMKELVDERLRLVPKIKQFSKENRERLDTLLQVGECLFNY